MARADEEDEETLIGARAVRHAADDAKTLLVGDRQQALAHRLDGDDGDETLIAAPRPEALSNRPPPPRAPPTRPPPRHDGGPRPQAPGPPPGSPFGAAPRVIVAPPPAPLPAFAQAAPFLPDQRIGPYDLRSRPPPELPSPAGDTRPLPLPAERGTSPAFAVPVSPSAPAPAMSPSAPSAPAAPSEAPPRPAPAPAPATLAPPLEGTPGFVIRFLLVCGVLTALGLMALIYLEL